MTFPRIERILNAMKANGLSQLLVSDPLVIRYLTEICINPGERLLALLLRTDGKHLLVLNDLFGAQPTDLPRVYYNDTGDGVAALCEGLFPGETLAVDKNWPARFLLRLQELVPGIHCVNSSFLVDDVRMIKDADEQAKMIAASIINDRVMGQLISELDGTQTEKELSARCKELYAEAGCSGTSFDPGIAYGVHTTDPHHEPDDTAGQDGDCLVIDIGSVKDCYCSDMTRTVFLGSVSDRQREIYEIVREANRRGIEAAKPGNRMCDVDIAARSYIEEKGFGKYFTHRTGHSIGRECHEAGDVSSVNTAVIRPGQCFSVEPGIYIPEESIGVRVEDLVLITEEGCRVLNSYPKDLIVIPLKK